MENRKVTLAPLAPEDREQFILDTQWAFRYGAMIEFGERDGHVDGDGEIISRQTIVQCLDAPENAAYRILLHGRKAGGVVLKIDRKTHHNHLELFFVLPEQHGKGIGYSAWKAVEAQYPETEVWETCTPYFEKRNIHFYVNKCGFHIVEFYNAFHTAPDAPPEEEDAQGPDEMFRFVKVMR